MVLALLALAPACGGSAFSGKEFHKIECNDLVPEIVDMYNDNAVFSELLKIYDVREVRRTHSLIRCHGDVIWSRGDDEGIAFHLQEVEGDWFIGYEVD